MTTTFRKISAVCMLVALLGVWAASDAAAGNKKSNPSPQGQANGVAHRVAALEATVAAQEERIAVLEDVALDLADLVNGLQTQVTGLEARVAALEAAAVTP